MGLKDFFVSLYLGPVFMEMKVCVAAKIFNVIVV